MRITIADYGLSNLLSVCRAVEKLGHTPHIARTGAAVREAEVLLLPGVGAFADGMQGLMERDMLQSIRGCAGSGVPILGICLGMQMLFESSREHGIHRGIGLIPGHVEAIPPRNKEGARLRVPHIGWETLLPPLGGHGVSPRAPFQLEAGAEVYFVHSFVAKPKDPAHLLAECKYGGYRLCAAVGKDNVYGVQFHPEKSGAAGLAVLGAFFERAATVASANPSA